MPESEHPVPTGRRRRRLLSSAAAVIATATVAAGGTYVAQWGPFEPDKPVIAPAAVAQAEAFLADWAGGRTESAGARTTSPDQARTALRNFTAGLDIAKPALTAGAASAAKDGTVTVAFSAKMPVTGLGAWSYDSRIPVRRQEDGAWKVAWDLSLVHPHLSSTEKFRLQRQDSATSPVTDRHGAPLSAGVSPSLEPVLDQIAHRAGAGPRGVIERIDRATGEVTGTEARFGAEGGASAGQTIPSTIDSTWQTAADQALAAKGGGKDAALVALRIDNGEILAVANSPAAGFNRALSGTYAPGSTWKIVTTSALLLGGAVQPGDIVDCPKYLTVGKEFHNVETSEFPGATFTKNFTESCNTGFISLRGKVGDGELGEVAGKYFGIGQKWNVGLPTFDGSVPAPGDQTEKAASMIGQGRVLGNPLTMASVAATAVSGSFHQPTITPDAEDRTTTTALPTEVVTQLRRLMRATVTDGTARGLAGLPGNVGAKTGTAEVSESAPNNGWVVATRGNVAVAAVVEGGITGGSSAVPVVRHLLEAVPHASS
ncbi:penicillin-binding transpeptidase domain-containing protein [Streptomyces sp. ME02-6991-2A]|uniref:penicillin-binding transpeptidase domain-containing protein n=1 Tax=Streptomyces TaxID=1883 RepID=UPI0029A56BCD|nr:penicillin-binding transpeptidase domain-containing protein [Streptomyces sp. ME02-6991-2A]MDX3373490.1 penicillin-binding transpeptidase domain-containing protein [Streptomyces sp. ME02-6991-2A]